MPRLPLFAALMVPALALAGCGQPKEISVSDAYVRLAAVPGRPAAAYFTIHGGAKDATLMSVSTEVAIRAELHESMKAGDVETMKPIGELPLPANGSLAFAPGGRHLMLYEVNPGIKPGTRVPLTFTFTNGLRIEYFPRAIAAGDPVPKG